MDFKHLCMEVCRWSSFVGAVCTFILGIVHICDIKARIYWPSGFIDDIQSVTWRGPLFSFQPQIFLDAWTPFVMGLAGSLAHLKSVRRLAFIVDGWINCFAWNMVMGLFATIAYNGGLGLIMSIVVWIAALLSLILIFWDGESTASLELNWDEKVGMSHKNRETVLG